MKTTALRTALFASLLPALVVVASCARRGDDDAVRIRLPQKLSALSVEDAQALVATLEIEGVLAETTLTISDDLTEASGSFVVDAAAATTAPFTLRLRYQPEDAGSVDTDILLARLAGEIEIVPNRDNVLEPAGDFDTCGASVEGAPCSLVFDLNRNGAPNLDDLVAGFDPRPPPPFVDVAPSDLTFPSGIRLGTFSRQVIVIENSSASPVEVKATLIDAPGATLQPFETEPGSETGAQRSLDLGVLDAFEEVLVAVSFAPVNPFLTVGDIFVEARDPATNVLQATRVRVLANVDGELQPPPPGFVIPGLAGGADLGGFDGPVETFATTSLFNGLPITSVQGESGSIAGLPFTGKTLTATFADGERAVPADTAFVVAVPAQHKLAVTLSGLESDMDLSVFLLDEGDSVTDDAARNTHVGKAATSAEAVEIANETDVPVRALVVLGRVELEAELTPNALTIDVPAPFALSAHVTSAPEFTAPLDPPGGPLEGGTRVTLRGKRFHPNARVTFADSIALDCAFREEGAETVFECTSPPGSLVVGKNPATIVVANPEQDAGGDGQAATLPEGFTYEPPAPRLDSLQPAVAPTTGSTAPITIRGAFFSTRNGPPRVLFDGEEATGVVYIDTTRLEVNAPAHGPGIVVVTVQNVLDPRAGDPVDFLRLSLPSNPRTFTYVTPDNPAPTLTSVDPANGSVEGNELITLTGTGFLDGAEVFVGGEAALDVTVTSGTTLTCLTPALAADGPVTVEIVNPDGQRASLAGAFSTFIPTPAVTSAFPDSATVAGGTFVVIEGSGFREGVRVEFDNGTVVVASPNPNRISSTTILAATPAVSTGGDYTLRVRNADGQQAELASAFRFVEPNGPPPVINSISPSAGNKDIATVITLTGRDFRGNPHPAIIAGTQAAEVLDSSTAGAIDTVTFTLPPQPQEGLVRVRLINDDGQSDFENFTAFAVQGAPPVIETLAPSVARSGTALVVTGRAFDDTTPAVVRVGGQPASNVTITSTRVTLVVPDLDAILGLGQSTVAVEIENGDGQGTSAALTYVVDPPNPPAPPRIDAITPDVGSPIAPTLVTLFGAFDPAATVTFAGALVSATRNADGSLAFEAPARGPGTVVVRVTNPDGASDDVAFRYLDAPPPPPAVIAFMDPEEVHAVAPGDLVDLVGQGLGPAESVLVEDLAQNVVGTAEIAARTGDLALVVRITSQLVDALTSGSLRFRVTMVDGSSVLSPTFELTVPRVSTLLDANRDGPDRVVFIGEDFAADRISSVLLASPAISVELPLFQASDTLLEVGPPSSSIPGVTFGFDVVYEDLDGSPLPPFRLENSPVFTESPLFLDAMRFDEPLPANDDPSGRVAVAIAGFLGDAAVGNPTTFEVADIGGTIVASGTWVRAFDGDGDVAVLTFASSAPVPPGSYSVRLQTDVTPLLAESPFGSFDGLLFVERDIAIAVPSVALTGGALSMVGTIFDGDAIVAEQTDTGTVTRIGTASTAGCPVAVRGCEFAGAFSTSPLPLNAGAYRLCVLPGAGPDACPASDIIINVADTIPTRTTFTDQNCQSVDHGSVSGNDRGGLAVTATKAYVTGDANTAIIDLATLDVTGTGFLHDSLFANPANGTLFVLANASLGDISANSGAFVVDTLRVIDPNNLSIISDVPLSQGIVVNTFTPGNALFVGEDILVLYSDITGDWFEIDLATFNVTLLPQRARPSGMSTCENWASWGIAAKNGPNHVVTYATFFPSIESFDVEANVFVESSSFFNLSDMCNIALVPGTNRWAFDHQFSSQLASGSEVFGTCDIVTCGDGICAPGSEDVNNCAEDCTAACGDGFCEHPAETPTTCSADCDPRGFFSICGNGLCEGQEPGFCAIDCAGEPGFCGNGLCEAGEDSFNCAEDCGGGVTSCGDGDCKPPESANTCAVDCGGPDANTFGDARDGDLNLGNVDLSVLTTGGRVCPDAVAVNVIGFPDVFTASTTPELPPGCFKDGDRVLLMNVQGNLSSTANVGVHEVLTVSGSSGIDVFFSTPRLAFYGDGPDDDTNIGLASGEQRVILQRLPQYHDVTVNGRVTTSAWDGQRGGILAFLANGTVTVAPGAELIVDGLGYRGGPDTFTPGTPGASGEGPASILGSTQPRSASVLIDNLQLFGGMGAGVAVDDQNNTYVVQNLPPALGGNPSVLRVDGGGQPTTLVESPVLLGGADIEVDNLGRAFVADGNAGLGAGGDQVLVIDLAGPTTTQLAVAANPTGLALDGNTLYVATYDTRQILIFDANTGDALGTLVADLGMRPLDIEMGPDGDLYVTGTGIASSDTRILRVTPTGDVTDFVDTGLPDPSGLAFDGAGNLWVSSYNGLKLLRITLDGAITTLPGAFVGDDAGNGLATDQLGRISVLVNGGNGRPTVTPAVIRIFGLAAPPLSKDHFSGGGGGLDESCNASGGPGAGGAHAFSGGDGVMPTTAACTALGGTFYGDPGRMRFGAGGGAGGSDDNLADNPPGGRGGNGGGVLFLTAADLILDGALRARGAPGFGDVTADCVGTSTVDCFDFSGPGGGGAGGFIRLFTVGASISGVIETSGGPGGLGNAATVGAGGQGAEGIVVGGPPRG